MTAKHNTVRPETEQPIARSHPDHPFMFIFGTYETFNKPTNFGKGQNSLVLPVAPPSFEYSIKNNAQVFTAMSGKAFSHAGSEDLMRISFESFLPEGLAEHDELPSFVYVNAVPASTSNFPEPMEFVEMVQETQAANQPFYFSVIQSRGTPRGTVIIPPTPMTVMDFTPSYTAGQGRDIAFSISLQKWNPQFQAMTTGTQMYTTVLRDRYHCGNIAAKQLGDMSRHKEIQKLNKTILDADHVKRVKAARTNSKVNPDFITPGTRLTLPLKRPFGGIGKVAPGTPPPMLSGG